MKNLYKTLSHKELDQLDEFLFNRINRIDEYAIDDNDDEGIVNISGLDGFFTAIASAPTMTLPSQWLPVIWGDYEPEFSNNKELENILSLFVRYLRGIITLLEQDKESYEPIFMSNEVNGETFLIVDDWCFGYVQGVALAFDESLSSKELQLLLVPILLFTSEEGWEQLDKLDKQQIRVMQNLIAPNVRSIFNYFEEQRSSKAPLIKQQPSQTKNQQHQPKISRNDPCHCGSGKKYKKCCLH